MHRLFVALMIPELQRQQMALLQGGLTGARWVEPEKFHLTLRFIGSVRPDDVRDITESLSRISAEAFDLHLNGIGVFDPGNRPRSLWAAVQDPDPLIALHEQCNQALRRLDVMEERRKFLPHVSLARLGDTPRGELVRYLEMHGGFACPSFVVDHFCLIRSHLGKSGAVYEIVEEFPLLDR